MSRTISHCRFALLGSLTGVALLTGCVTHHHHDDAVDSVEYTRTTKTYSPGYVTRTLPANHTVRTYRGANYYVADNVYYRKTNGGYTVVDSPFAPAPTLSAYRPGYEVGELPAGYRTRKHRGVDYYVADNVWYRPHRGGYVVVEAPL